MTRDPTAVTQRITRAFDEFFHVESAAADGEYTVYSGSGNTYIVSLPAGACTCPDGQRGAWCKHAFRVAFVTGELPNVDGVTGEPEDRNDAEKTAPTYSNDDTDADASETLPERVERYTANNPDASAIEILAQLGINPSQKERVEEVLA